MLKAKSLNAATVEMDEAPRKRQIHEVADAEPPPNSSRLRASPNQETVGGGLSDDGGDNFQDIGGSESDFTSAEEEDSDNGDTRDSSYEYNGEETVEQFHTVTEQGKNGQSPASRAIPQSWEEASEADRILVKMKGKGLSWDEIGKAWKEETGQDTAHIVLLNRYNRLKDNVQVFRDGDSERLLAAVEEVKAAFEREKWQLVKNAMNRAGAAEYSKGFIRKQYKKLAWASTKANATRSRHKSKIETSTGIVPTKESRIAGVKAVADPAPVNFVPTPLELRPSDTVTTRTDPSPNEFEVSADTPVTMSADQNSKESGAVKKEARLEGAAEALNAGVKGATKTRELAKPGSLATNAILVDDTVSATSPALKVTDPVASFSQPVANSAAPRPRSGAGGPALISRPAQGLGITPSRVGSATNWGPAKFTSLHKATDDDAIRKQRNALNSSPDPTKIGIGKSPINAGPGTFGMLVNQGALKYRPHNVPSNIQQRIAMQKSGPAEKGPPHTPSQSQQAPLVTPARPQRVSTEELANTQPAIAHTPILHGLHVEAASTKPLPYQKPPELQRALQPEITQQQSPIQSIEVESQNKASSPTNGLDAPAADVGSLGRDRKPVNTDQLNYMVRHRTLYDANRIKTWDVIARECGVTATLAEISVALEQAGYPRILNTSEPFGPAIPATPILSAESKAAVSSYAPTPPSQKPPSTELAATPAVSTAPARAIETPAPATAPSLDGTPNTRSKRGRPSGSKNKAKDQVPGEESSMSPSQTKTPLSGQKGHVRSAAARAAQSAGMKAAWKRRKERAMNGRHDGSPKPNTAAGDPLIGSSTAAFAAEILAAAAGNISPASTPTPQVARASAPSARPELLDDEPVDLLTGESMFAQHYDDPQPAQLPGPPPAKKIPGLDAEAERPNSKPKHSNGYIRGPYRKRADGEPNRYGPFACQKCHKVWKVRASLKNHLEHHPDCEKELPKRDRSPDKANELRPYACQKCHKMYKNSGGLKYHLEHHPDCEKEPPKRDSRTDPPAGNALKSSTTPQQFESGAVAAPVAQMRSHGTVAELSSLEEDIYSTFIW